MPSWGGLSNPPCSFLLAQGLYSTWLLASKGLKGAAQRWSFLGHRLQFSFRQCSPSIALTTGEIK